MARHLAVGDSSGPLAIASASYYNPTGVLLAPGETYEIAADDSRWVDWHLASSADGRIEPSLIQSMAHWALFAYLNNHGSVKVTIKRVG